MDDGVRLWASMSGAGAPVVLIHGGAGLWNNLTAVESMLADEMAVRYDQRGCGRSSGDGPYTVDRFVADLDGLREQGGWESWTIAGHSWGASLALAYAWRYPQRVKALVYISGTGLGMEWRNAHREQERIRLTVEQNQRLEELSGRKRNDDEEREFLTLAWSRDFADRDTALAQAAALLDDRFRVNYECNAQINAECKTWQEEDLVKKCRALDMPVLVIHGSEDPRPAWATDSLVDALPNVERVIIEGAGHLPWVERTDETRLALRTFLKQQVSA